MTAPVLFEVRVLAGLEIVEEFSTTSAPAALEWARSRVSPSVTHVSIEACAGDPSTFAMRYLTPTRPSGGGDDSGWRCFRDGTFVSVHHLETLFPGIAVEVSDVL